MATAASVGDAERWRGGADVRAGRIGPAGLTRDPRARKTDDRQTTVAVGDEQAAVAGYVCVCVCANAVYAMPVGVAGKSEYYIYIRVCVCARTCVCVV